MSLETGTQATAQLTVSEADLASALFQQDSDGFPPVFATARMIGLMELAASRVMHPLLEGDELSVGVTVDVKHSAATPLGDLVTATATFLGMEGRLYRFEIAAEDQAGEIGRGTHLRAKVSNERLLAGCAKRRM